MRTPEGARRGTLDNDDLVMILPEALWVKSIHVTTAYSAAQNIPPARLNTNKMDSIEEALTPAQWGAD